MSPSRIGYCVEDGSAVPRKSIKLQLELESNEFAGDPRPSVSPPPVELCLLPFSSLSPCSSQIPSLSLFIPISLPLSVPLPLSACLACLSICTAGYQCTPQALNLAGSRSAVPSAVFLSRPGRVLVLGRRSEGVCSGSAQGAAARFPPLNTARSALNLRTNVRTRSDVNASDAAREKETPRFSDCAFN